MLVLATGLAQGMDIESKEYDNALNYFQSFIQKIDPSAHNFSADEWEDSIRSVMLQWDTYADLVEAGNSGQLKEKYLEYRAIRDREKERIAARLEEQREKLRRDEEEEEALQKRLQKRKAAVEKYEKELSKIDPTGLSGKVNIKPKKVYERELQRKKTAQREKALYKKAHKLEEEINTKRRKKRRKRDISVEHEASGELKSFSSNLGQEE